MSDFNDVLDGSPEHEEPVETQEAQEPEQQEAQAAEPEQAEPEQAEAEQDSEPKTEDEPTVPLAVFKSMRDDLKSQLDQFKSQLTPQQPQEAPKPPDMFEQPEQYQQFMAAQLQQVQTGTKLEMSRFMAEREFGKEAVEEVVSYFNDHPELSHQFLSAPSPFHAAKEYVDAQKTAREIGNDPEAYKAKLEAEVRKKIEAEMAAKQAQEMAAKAAPSLADTNGNGGQRDPGWQGPADLTSLIGE